MVNFKSKMKNKIKIPYWRNLDLKIIFLKQQHTLQKYKYKKFYFKSGIYSNNISSNELFTGNSDIVHDIVCVQYNV